MTWLMVCHCALTLCILAHAINRLLPSQFYYFLFLQSAVVKLALLQR